MASQSAEVLAPVLVLPSHNPWAVPTAPVESCALSDVMSEQLAQSLQNAEENVININSCELPRSLVEGDTSSDLTLAKMLQDQFDKEHDTMIRLEEKKFNGSSKVSVSFSNYMNVPEDLDEDSDDDDMYFYDEDNRRWDSFEHAEKTQPNIGKSGFVRQGDVITTKHDPAICGRRNARRVMQLPSIQTGDGGGFDMKLSNAVYNRLKVHSQSEEKRMRRIHDKVEKSTAELAVDASTRLLLYKLINNEVLEAISGVISTGKESVVFHATGGSTDKLEDAVPSECAIKAFKTTLNEFKNREEYMHNDYRFRHRFSKQNPRKLIPMWAEKEMHNLKRIHDAGLPCPKVVLLRKHVLVMEFIGKDQVPAPKLKEMDLPPDLLQDAYAQILDLLKKLYSACRLVHADFSEYNLLWHEGKVWVIDVSQAVDLTHPHAHEFLLRDCTNVVTFFSKRGLADVPSAKDLFAEVSGIDLFGSEAEVLHKLQDFEKNLELVTFGQEEKEYAFDYFFDVTSSRPEDFPAGLVKVPLSPPKPFPQSKQPKHHGNKKYGQSPPKPSKFGQSPPNKSSQHKKRQNSEGGERDSNQES